MCRRNRRDRIMSHSNILTNIASTTRPTRTAKRRNVGPALRRRKPSRNRPRPAQASQRTTIAGIIKATGWQDHSVRSFLVTIVLKKLGFALSSKQSMGTRLPASPAQLHPSGPERSRKDVKHRSMRRGLARSRRSQLQEMRLQNDDLQHRAINHVDRSRPARRRRSR